MEIPNKIVGNILGHRNIMSCNGRNKRNPRGWTIDTADKDHVQMNSGTGARSPGQAYLVKTGPDYILDIWMADKTGEAKQAGYYKSTNLSTILKTLYQKLGVTLKEAELKKFTGK